MPKLIALTTEHIELLRRIDTAGTLLRSQLSEDEHSAVVALSRLGWAVTMHGRISLTNNGRNCLGDIDKGGRDTIA